MMEPRTKSKSQQQQHYADDDTSYLSKETIRRREDRKLIDYITSTLYRLELENVKPSFEVKMRAGLHRGPYQSARSRRRPKSTTGSTADDLHPARSDGVDTRAAGPTANGSAAPRSRHHQPPSASALHRPAVDDSDVDDIRQRPSQSRHHQRDLSAGADRDEIAGVRLPPPPVDDYRPLPAGSNSYHHNYYYGDDVDDDPVGTIDRYATLPRRWLAELGRIEADSRRRAATSVAREEHQQSVETAAKDRRSAAASEFDNLMTYLHEEQQRDRTDEQARRPRRPDEDAFFFDDRRSTAAGRVRATDGGSGSDSLSVEMLMDRPFGRLNEPANGRRHYGHLLY